MQKEDGSIGGYWDLELQKLKSVHLATQNEMNPIDTKSVIPRSSLFP